MNCEWTKKLKNYDFYWRYPSEFPSLGCCTTPPVFQCDSHELWWVWVGRIISNTARLRIFFQNNNNNSVLKLIEIKQVISYSKRTLSLLKKLLKSCVSSWHKWIMNEQLLRTLTHRKLFNYSHGTWQGLNLLKRMCPADAAEQARWWRWPPSLKWMFSAAECSSGGSRRAPARSRADWWARRAARVVPSASWFDSSWRGTCCRILCTSCRWKSLWPDWGSSEWTEWWSLWWRWVRWLCSFWLSATPFEAPAQPLASTWGFLYEISVE